MGIRRGVELQKRSTTRTFNLCLVMDCKEWKRITPSCDERCVPPVLTKGDTLSLVHSHWLFIVDKKVDVLGGDENKPIRCWRFRSSLFWSRFLEIQIICILTPQPWRRCIIYFLDADGRETSNLTESKTLDGSLTKFKIPPQTYMDTALAARLSLTSKRTKLRIMVQCAFTKYQTITSIK